MTDINWMKGDLIELARDGRFDTIAHGCNCFHTMGSGIAPLMNNLTEGRLLKADKQTPYGNINKLGTVSYVSHEVNGKRIELFNLYTQYTYGNGSKGEVYVNWQSLYDSLGMMFDFTVGEEIGIPLIGCGLAGGSRDDFIDVMHQLVTSRFQYPVNLTVVEMC